MKSMSRVSAQWMSSMTMTTGASEASTSTKRRSAQKVSSTEPATPAVIPVRSRRMRSRSGTASRDLSLEVMRAQHLDEGDQTGAALDCAPHPDDLRTSQRSRRTRLPAGSSRHQGRR